MIRTSLALGERPEARHILIVGSDGVIGSALKSRLASVGFVVTATTRRCSEPGTNEIYLDLARPETFQNLRTRQYDVAVLCAAVTSMQACEEQPEASWLVNVAGNIAITELLSEQGTRIVFLSSSMVFDESSALAKATDEPNPVTTYGRQKAEAEKAILAAAPGAAIIRFAKVLPPDHTLFRDWIAALRVRRPISPFSNKTLAPVSLEFALDMLTAVITSRLDGIHQISAERSITYAEAASMLADLVGAPQDLIQPCHDDRQYVEHDRPELARLDCADCLRVLGSEAPDALQAIRAIYANYPP